MTQFKIICGKCEKEIKFTTQLESGYRSAWDMFETLIEETNDKAIKCPHCGDFNWNPFGNVMHALGKEKGINDAIKNIERLIRN